MSDIAIRAQNLSKLYRIGKSQQRHDTLRDALVAGFQAPLQRLRRDGQGTAVPSESTMWALKDVSFEVRRGEVVGLIGPNGAGKSTLLKILSRITEPTEGRAEIYGRTGSMLEVGTGFHPELTGRENIHLNGAILGMKRAEIARKFDEIVSFAEIERFLDTPVKRYSSGMYVRLAFAVAAHLEPEILLVDEVLAVGDLDFQKKCLGKMGRVASEGRTVVFVSHNMGAIMDLTERCILLKGGKVAQSGNSQQVVETYLENSKSISDYDASAERKWNFAREGLRCAINDVRLVTGSKRIAVDDPIDVEITCMPYQDLDGVVFGIGIANTFGTRLISCRSDDDSITLRLQQGVPATLHASIPSPQLVPGKYLLQAVVMRRTKTLDYVGDALLFEIIGDTRDQWALNRSNLGVRLPSTWGVL